MTRMLQGMLLLVVTACLGIGLSCGGGDRTRAGDRGQTARGGADTAEVHAKVQRVQEGVKAMKARGEDPRPVFVLMKDVEPLLKKGRSNEAMDRIERALAIVEPGYEPGTPVASPTADVAERPSGPLAPGAPAGRGWRHASTEPVMDVLRRPRGLSRQLARAPLTNWNDPSVMKEDGRYVMWASLGMKGGGRDVAIYQLTSPDGLDWTVANGGEPVLEGGGRGDWDGYGVETPAVIRVGGTYHMYYTAYKEPGGHLFTMGHATSQDGVHWTKQGELTSLTGVVGKRDGNPWGWLARAEPTAVHHDGEFWLYFTDVRCRVDCKRGPAPAIRGISLARSRDGQHFEQVGDAPVLLQSDSYPASAGWEGYSTPWVLYDGGEFHLFVDLFHKGTHHYQTRIAHYASRDGVRFREVQPDVIRVEGHPWATQSVRAPSVIRENGRFLMWYAGDSFDQANKPRNMLEAIQAGRIRMGIAMATSER